MSAIFKKSDIKAGYLLVVKDIDSGEVFNMTVVPGLSFGEEKLGVCCPDKHWWSLDTFDDDLQYVLVSSCEVQAVYGYAFNRLLLANTTEDRELLWKREPDAKKMTVAEIAKALGYPVEIVEG